MTRRVAAILVAVALLAAACGSDVPEGAPTLVTTTRPAESAPAATTPTIPETTATPLPVVSIDQVDCPDDLVRDDDVGIACGVLTVPIDRTNGDLGTTRVTLATVAGYDSGFETPLAVMQGGPGGASTGLATWFPQQPFTQVFIDQRGTGFVGPEFDCPEIFDVLGSVFDATTAEGNALAERAYRQCAERLDSEVVLQHTESEEHASDVADAMAVLGYGRWAAYGVSYGSTIGLELLRDEPDGLAGVVLDGVYPADLDADAGLAESANRALDLIDAECASDAVCSRFVADGSVRETMNRVIQELDANPMIVPLGGNQIGYARGVDLVLDGQRAAELSFLMMYHESLLRYLPAVIGGLDDRDESSARWLAGTGARLLLSSQAANDEGTYFAVQCHDRLGFSDGPGDDLAPFAAAVSSATLEGSCADWDRELADESVDDPVSSALPALLLSGTFDPITPPEYAEHAATSLVNATVVVQDGRGHGIWFGSDCIAHLVQLFVEDPARTLDSSCADQGEPIEWARP